MARHKKSLSRTWKCACQDRKVQTRYSWKNGYVHFALLMGITLKIMKAVCIAAERNSIPKRGGWKIWTLMRVKETFELYRDGTLSAFDREFFIYFMVRHKKSVR